ncbi:MAG: hypothetical protein U0350_24755 [Caldilineaceae bacterium]
MFSLDSVLRCKRSMYSRLGLYLLLSCMFLGTTLRTGAVFAHAQQSVSPVEEVVTYVAKAVDDHSAPVVLDFARLLQTDSARKQLFFEDVGMLVAGLGRGEDAEKMVMALIEKNPELSGLAAGQANKHTGNRHWQTSFLASKTPWWQKAILLVLVIVIIAI